jgi:hypothetical protein
MGEWRRDRLTGLSTAAELGYRQRRIKFFFCLTSLSAMVKDSSLARGEPDTSLGHVYVHTTENTWYNG